VVTLASPSLDQAQTWKATPQQKEADRYADMLCKFFRAVPSSQLESIDKAILDELVRVDIWAQKEHRDTEGRPRVNFRTIALHLGVDERTISRRWHDRLQYSNLIKSYGKDEKTDRWYILVDRALYTQAALAYHAAMKQAANAGQKISDPGLLTFSAPIAQRGTCTHCQAPMEARKMETRDMVITYYRCPKCKRRHKQVVKDSGWMKPEAQGLETPIESADEIPLPTCQAFKEAVTPPMAALVDLYTSLAGEDETHIRMTGSSSPKYTTHPDKLSGDQLEAHISGADTYGSRMWRKDGLTRGFLVDARAGWQRIYEIASEWEGLEHWPLPVETPAGNRTRLPGGVYRMPGFSGWCELYSITDCESSSNGIEAAALLYTHQSSAALIPPYSEPTQEQEQAEPEAAPLRDCEPPDNLSGQSENNHYLIKFKACDLAARFLDEHQLADYLERGKNGKYFSPNGSERTPSAALYSKDGRELLTDFSTHGARSDGTHDTVDALELYSRQSGRVKRDVLKELGQLVHREAKAAIEAAAHDGTTLPGWIETRLTEYGRATFERLRLEAGGVTALKPPPETGVAPPQSDEEQLRREIGELARAEEEKWELSDELDPAWPPSAKVYKRIRRKELPLWTTLAAAVMP
jgi:hypothetical protein